MDVQSVIEALLIGPRPYERAGLARASAGIQRELEATPPSPARASGWGGTHALMTTGLCMPAIGLYGKGSGQGTV